MTALDHPTELPWFEEAELHLGEREIPGVNHNPLVIRMWKAIKRGGIKTDEVPWCAAFVGFCLEQSGIVSSRFESARSYLTWGVATEPCYGCIVVFERKGGGHVGFVVGKDRFNNLLVLGGNQGNAVSIAAFNPNRVVGYRWPKAVPNPNLPLPTGLHHAAISTNEA